MKDWAEKSQYRRSYVYELYTQPVSTLAVRRCFWACVMVASILTAWSSV